MTIRRRLIPGLVGLALFVGFGALYESHVWREPWFFIGVGVFLSATFVEPFFTRPQDAIVNTVGGIGAFFSSQTSAIHGLWLAYLGCMIAILLAGVTATIATNAAGLTKWASFRAAARFGRAAVVGGAALFLVVLDGAATGKQGFEYLAAGTALLLAGVGFDWSSVLMRMRHPAESASAVAAIGPRMLLVAAAGSTTFREGDGVSIEARGQHVRGTIIVRLPHHDGLRYQIALGSDWSDVSTSFPDDLVLRSSGENADLIGAVGDGTTDLSLSFEPFRPVEIGSPVALHVEERVLLYQVARLRLVNSSWAGASALVAQATAGSVGWPGADGTIRSGSYLPQPHELIYRADGLAQGLPADHYEIGFIKGTAVAIGLRVDDERRGHIAILGMSGMGKSAVAHRICRTLGENNTVVALDTTGEYASRLGVPRFEDDLTARGFSVYEPSGDPPEKGAEFIKRCMDAGVAEYRDEEAELLPRVLLLEEAHSFVPEWNFALRGQQDHVAYSTRMIMQARKFAITFVIVSQRTAVVSKSALSQCENYIILKTIDQTSLDYLESVVGPEMRNAIPSLNRFEAICVGPAFNTEEAVIVSLSAP